MNVFRTDVLYYTQPTKHALLLILSPFEIHTVSFYGNWPFSSYPCPPRIGYSPDLGTNRQ